MNLFDTILLILLLIIAIIGWKRGFIKSTWDIINLFVSTGLTVLVSPKIALLLNGSTPSDNWLQRAVTTSGSFLYKILRLPDANMNLPLSHPNVSSYIEDHAMLRGLFDFAKVNGTNVSLSEALSISLLCAVIGLCVFCIVLLIINRIGIVVTEKLKKRFENNKSAGKGKTMGKISGSLIYILVLLIAVASLLNQPFNGNLSNGLGKSLAFTLFTGGGERPASKSDISASPVPKQQPTQAGSPLQTQPSPQQDRKDTPSPSPNQQAAQPQTQGSSVPNGTQGSSVQPTEVPTQASQPAVNIEGLGEYQPLSIPVNEFIPVTGTTPTVINEKPKDAQFVMYSAIGPAEEERKFVHDNLSVSIPQMTMQQYATFSVRKQDRLPMAVPDGIEVLSLYDVTLSNMTVLPEAITIEIPYRGSENAGAIYYNGREQKWEQIPWEKKGDAVTIKTNHLSSFALTEEKSDYYYNPDAKTFFWYPSSNVTYSIQDIEKILSDSTEKSAMVHGWEAAKTWFDIGALTGSMIDDVIYEVPGLSTVNKVVGNMGLGFSALQIISDVADGNVKSAGSQAYEASLGFAVAKWGIKGMQVGLIGVTIMNQALVTFTQEAIAGKEKVYEDAYNLYYSRNSGISTSIQIRKTTDWYNVFKNIVKTAASPDEASRRIKEDIETYVNAFWNDIDGRSQCFAYITQRNSSSQSFGFDAGINEGLKKRLNDNHKGHLNDFLNNILTRVMIQIENEEIERFQKEEMRAVAEALNTEYHIWVRVEGAKELIGDLDIRFNDTENQKNWQGKTDANGNWNLRYTLLGLMRAGMPDKVILTDKSGNTYKADFNPETSMVSFQIAGKIPNPEMGIDPEKTSMKVGEKIKLNPSFDGKQLRSTDVIWETEGGIISDNTFIPYAHGGEYSITGQKADGRSTEASVKMTVTEDLLSSKIKEYISKYGFKLSPDIDYSKLIRSVSPEGEVYFYIPTPTVKKGTYAPDSKSPKEGIVLQYARKSTFEKAVLFQYRFTNEDFYDLSLDFDIKLSEKYADTIPLSAQGYPPLDLLNLTESEWNDIVLVSIHQYKDKKKHGMQMSLFPIEPVHSDLLRGDDPNWLHILQTTGSNNDIRIFQWRVLSEPRIAIIAYYKDGLKHGDVKTYWVNGKLRESATYDNGKLQGKASRYRLDGSAYK